MFWQWLRPKVERIPARNQVRSADMLILMGLIAETANKIRVCHELSVIMDLRLNS
jgi:hypothetical protein